MPIGEHVAQLGADRPQPLERAELDPAELRTPRPQSRDVVFQMPSPKKGARPSLGSGTPIRPLRLDEAEQLVGRPGIGIDSFQSYREALKRLGRRSEIRSVIGNIVPKQMGPDTLEKHGKYLSQFFGGAAISKYEKLHRPRGLSDKQRQSVASFLGILQLYRSKLSVQGQRDIASGAAPFNRHQLRRQLLVDDEKADPDAPQAVGAAGGRALAPVGHLAKHHVQVQKPMVQARAIGYQMRADGDLAPPRGRAHLVQMGDFADPEKHFMRQISADSNLGAKSIKRSGPFKQERGRSHVMSRSANVLYRKRPKGIQITLQRGISGTEMDHLISKLTAHRLSTHSTWVYIIGDKREKYGKLHELDLESFRAKLYSLLSKGKTVGIELVDHAQKGTLHKPAI